MPTPLMRLITAVLILAAGPASGLAEDRVEQRVRVFAEDRDSLQAKYRVDMAEETAERMKADFRQKLDELRSLDFDSLSRDEQVDAVLLRAEIEHALRLQERDAKADARAADLIAPVRPLVETLHAALITEQVKAKDVARMFSDVAESLQKKTAAFRDDDRKAEPLDNAAKADALWAARRIDDLRRDLTEFHQFRDGYDPLYTWWCSKPQEGLDAALADYTRAIRETLVGVKEGDDDTIIGVPIGTEALLGDLRHEFIAYPPQRLMEIAERELAWCDREMKAAAAEMGLGDDWRAALDRTKEDYVDPGEQPALIRTLAEEATALIEEKGLITLPPLCKESWRMEMMTPQRQRVNPFFTGGPVISISYPTADMTFPEKLMGMRGNNPHFCRATVHHELIPGHHLQLFMMPRHRPYRQVFRTPFWIEGWALYWEMRLWDMGFARNAKEKMGMLFWRKHRAARILFSLRYQTGEWTPEQCVEFLIETVGFERKNATAEVRRSVMGGYSPLYQAAYMLGGLQMRDLHRDVVEGGRMSEREFHDFVLRQNAIPLDLIRMQLLEEPLTLDHESDWEF